MNPKFIPCITRMLHRSGAVRVPVCAGEEQILERCCKGCELFVDNQYIFEEEVEGDE